MLNLMVALKEMFGDHQSHDDLFSGDHECLNQISSKSIQFSLDQTGRPTDQHCRP